MFIGVVTQINASIYCTCCRFVKSDKTKKFKQNINDGQNYLVLLFGPNSYTATCVAPVFVICESGAREMYTDFLSLLRFLAFRKAKTWAMKIAVCELGLNEIQFVFLFISVVCISIVFILGYLSDFQF